MDLSYAERVIRQARESNYSSYFDKMFVINRMIGAKRIMETAQVESPRVV